MGRRAEMSCCSVGMKVYESKRWETRGITNERRYESKDSREMVNCSISPVSVVALLLWLEARERYRRGQGVSFSGGEGCESD